jgi:hypothetical protein
MQHLRAWYHIFGTWFDQGITAKQIRSNTHLETESTKVACKQSGAMTQGWLLRRERRGGQDCREGYRRKYEHKSKFTETPWFESLSSEYRVLTRLVKAYIEKHTGAGVGAAFGRHAGIDSAEESGDGAG